MKNKTFFKTTSRPAALTKSPALPKNPQGYVAGKSGGVLNKVSAGKMGVQQSPKTTVNSDRGAFTIK